MLTLANLRFRLYSSPIRFMIYTVCPDREMRCLRNKIHSNLFLTFILTNTCWIITAVMQSLHTSSSSLGFSWCVSLIFSRYFHLATFFWMFVEG